VLDRLAGSPAANRRPSLGGEATIPAVAPVFDLVERTNSEPATMTESTFGFLNRAAGPFWQRVSYLVEDWSAALPPDGQSDAIGRLSSGDNDSFRATFFELYCFQIFKRSGHALTCHPVLPNVSRRPDFLASGRSADLVVEVTTTGTPAAEAARTARMNAVHDEINHIRVTNFMLHMTVIHEGAQPPPVAGLRRDLEQWLGSLDVDEVATAMTESDADYLIDPETPRHTWTHEDWELEFNPIPLRPEARDQPVDRPIGSWSAGEAAMIDDASPIRDRLRHKARHYGVLQSPYLIAIETSRPFADDDDFVDALFGTLAYSFYEGVAESGKWIRQPTGLWRSRSGWQYANVSGVISANNVNPWTVGEIQPTLWHHPAATYPVTDGPSLCRHARLDQQSGQLRYTPAITDPRAFFDLAAEWPGPEQRFPIE
jgi:hypothetical protein